MYLFQVTAIAAFMSIFCHAVSIFIFMKPLSDFTREFFGATDCLRCLMAISSSCLEHKVIAGRAVQRWSLHGGSKSLGPALESDSLFLAPSFLIISDLLWCQKIFFESYHSVRKFLSSYMIRCLEPSSCGLKLCNVLCWWDLKDWNDNRSIEECRQK